MSIPDALAASLLPIKLDEEVYHLEKMVHKKKVGEARLDDVVKLRRQCDDLLTALNKEVRRADDLGSAVYAFNGKHIDPSIQQNVERFMKQDQDHAVRYVTVLCKEASKRVGLVDGILLKVRRILDRTSRKKPSVKTSVAQGSPDKPAGLPKADRGRRGGQDGKMKEGEGGEEEAKEAKWAEEAAGSCKGRFLNEEATGS